MNTGIAENLAQLFFVAEGGTKELIRALDRVLYDCLDDKRGSVQVDLATLIGMLEEQRLVRGVVPFITASGFARRPVVFLCDVQQPLLVSLQLVSLTLGFWAVDGDVPERVAAEALELAAMGAVRGEVTTLATRIAAPIFHHDEPTACRTQLLCGSTTASTDEDSALAPRGTRRPARTWRDGRVPVPRVACRSPGCAAMTLCSEPQVYRACEADAVAP